MCHHIGIVTVDGIWPRLFWFMYHIGVTVVDALWPYKWYGSCSPEGKRAHDLSASTKLFRAESMSSSWNSSRPQTRQFQGLRGPLI